jgi:hypothetical protein
MIEKKFLPEQLVEAPQYENSVRGIAGVDNIKATLVQDL